MNRFRLLALPLLLAAAAARAVPAAVSTAIPAATPAVASASAAPSVGSLLQVLFGLVTVLALMAGAAWLMKRFGAARTAAGSAVKIVGGVSVGNRERVLVLEVADQWIVVGVAAGRVSALANLPRQERLAETANPASAAPATSFSDWLKQIIDKRNGNR